VRPVWIARLAPLGFCFVTLPAFGQDVATAVALFDRGVAEMEVENYAAGCPAIAESLRLDPRPGTLFTLAECEGKWGKVASAAAHYGDYIGLVSRLPSDQQARHQERVRMAESALARIQPTVPTLTLVLPPEAPEGTVVTRDGLPLQGASLGLPLPVDPGEHVIVTRAPGGPDKETRVNVVLGEGQRLTLEVLPAAPVAAVPPPAPPPENKPTAQPTAQPAPKPASSRADLRPWAYMAGGVGAASLVAGSVAGLVVMSSKKTVDDQCAGKACSPEGLAAAETGKNVAVVANVAFGISAVALGAAVALFLLSPSDEKSEAATVTPLLGADRHGGFAGLSGRF